MDEAMLDGEPCPVCGYYGHLAKHHRADEVCLACGRDWGSHRFTDDACPIYVDSRRGVVGFSDRLRFKPSHFGGSDG